MKSPKKRKTKAYVVYSGLSDGIMNEMFIDEYQAKEYMENKIHQWKMPHEPDSSFRDWFRMDEIEVSDSVLGHFASRLGQLLAQDRAAKIGCCSKCRTLNIPPTFGLCNNSLCPCHAPIKDSGEESWFKEFDDTFSAELIDRFQEYAYSEKHINPLAEAMEKKESIKSFIRTIISKEREKHMLELTSAKLVTTELLNAARQEERTDLIREIEKLIKYNQCKSGCGCTENTRFHEGECIWEPIGDDTTLSLVVDLIKKRK